MPATGHRSYPGGGSSGWGLAHVSRRGPGLAFYFARTAGEGFAHVRAEGDLEPCPFSPLSDTNLREVPLRVALQSRLLRNIRESGEHLSEAGGGCALWDKRDWARSMMAAPDSAGAAAPGPEAGLASGPTTTETRRAA